VSEKKRDLRGYLPPAIYAAMEVKLEAEGEGETVAAYLERLVTKDVGDWLHRTSVAADKLHRRGILRSAADSLGVPRK
jgi:hypothetical protein